MRSAGIVAIDNNQKWIGGRYYLHHLIRCVTALPLEEQIRLRDVSWVKQLDDDPFTEVRSLIGEPVIVSPPNSYFGRFLRKLRSLHKRYVGTGDLFKEKGIDVVFPIPPCDNAGVPYVFWLADFQYLRRPDLMSPQLCAELEQYFYQHVHAASQIVLSSEDAKNDFAGVYPQFLDRTHVVRFCSVPDEEWWKLDPLEVAAKYNLPDKFLIVCNQFTRHKNHLTLIKALQILSENGEEDIHLVCTGSTFDHRQEDYIGQVKAFLSQHGMEQRIHILGLIPRADQIALLRQSVAVMQPSWFEGWSTIIEDAKTLSKMVLASDLPVHREQLGPEHPYYLSLEHADAWASSISTVWASLEPGPKSDDEKTGLQKLEIAKRECGLAFVKALESAINQSKR